MDKAEIDAVLSPQASPVFCQYYGVTTDGNFEGKNILNVSIDISETAARFNLTTLETEKILNESRELLLTEREKRVRPGLDDKVLTAWNGLMLTAFARSYQVMRDPAYKDIIVNNIAFIRKNLYTGRHLLRTFGKQKAKYHGYLDDYAFLIQGLLDSYEALFEAEYLQLAAELMAYVDTYFWDDTDSGYFYTSSEQEKLLHRLKDAHDQSIPSGTGIMLLNNLKFYTFTEEKSYLDHAEEILKRYSEQIKSNPYAFASYLAGVDYYLRKPKEIVLMIPQDVTGEDILQSVFNTYQPNKAVMVFRGEIPESMQGNSLLKGKTAIAGKMTAYVCHNFACSRPVFTAAELSALLR